VKTQQQLVAELRAAQADLRANAAATERRRIAADIHDVVAHSFAVTLLHLTGARLLALRRNDGLIAAALEDAERAGREGMRELRGVVGLLSEQDESLLGPSIGAAGIVGLADQYRRAGVDVSLSIEGELGAVSTLPGVALFRIAQEALANVARHAPKAATGVAISVGDRVTLVVRNDVERRAGSPLHAQGYGIAGMRERARQAGGSLVVQQRGHAWVVECSLPNGSTGDGST
jgi:signal transduction histidine kinase